MEGNTRNFQKWKKVPGMMFPSKNGHQLASTSRQRVGGWEGNPSTNKPASPTGPPTGHSAGEFWKAGFSSSDSYFQCLGHCLEDNSFKPGRLGMILKSLDAVSFLSQVEES